MKYIHALILLINLFNIDGVWYSDYKSASSVERVEAFLKLGRKDPAQYADENGPVEWWQVVYQVCKVLFGYER